MLRSFRIFVWGVLLLAGPAAGRSADELREKFWGAVRDGNLDSIQSVLADGVDVNAANEIGITALWIAAGKEKLDVVDLLLKQGADPNARDRIWYQTPLNIAVRGGNLEIARCLIDAGATDLDEPARTAAAGGRLELLGRLLETQRVTQGALDAMLFSSAPEKAELRSLLENAGARPVPPAAEDAVQRWQALAGTYENDNATPLELVVRDAGLVMQSPSGDLLLQEVEGQAFIPLGQPQYRIQFEFDGAQVRRFAFRRFTAETYYYPAAPPATPLATVEPVDESTAGPVQPLDWPQFRGPDATGIGDQQNLPVTWDLKTGRNLKWKTAIPGLGHSCPVTWQNRIFLTTAISGDPNPKIRVGNYGDVDSVDDLTEHRWQVLCLDRTTGEILWNREVHKGVPKIKRHLKGSQANCTVATDGLNVVACFGSEGLYCLGLDGTLRWSRDLSAIDSSFALDEEYEWGFAASPLIFSGQVIVQYDLSRDSQIAAYRLADGDKLWETPRDEIPSWSSPTIWRNSLRTELVTNASQFARGYDPLSGRELWRLAKKSEATIPAPVPAGDRLVLCSGNRPIQPIIVLKPGADGEIELPPHGGASAEVAWSTMRGGPYMPTPIVYQERLYICSNAGVLTCYQLDDGKLVYRQRIGGLSYTASLVASDGKIYCVSEQGEVRVVRAGDHFELLAVNDLDDLCMATPAISGGLFIVRTQHHLIAFQQGASLSSGE